MKLTKLKVNTLVEDFDLYPRASVDSGHITHIAEAFEAGTKLPAPIVEQKTLRIVDGFHRCRAWRRIHGEDADIEVEVRSYPDHRALFLEAMRLNAGHGRNMTTYDRAHAIARAQALKITNDLIATALNIRLEKLTKVTATRLCKVTNTMQQVPIKLSVRHMAGRTLNKQQAEVMPRLGGNQQLFYVNQLITLIDNGLLDTDNGPLMEHLRTLHTKIGALLAK